MEAIVVIGALALLYLYAKSQSTAVALPQPGAQAVSNAPGPGNQIIPSANNPRAVIPQGVVAPASSLVQTTATSGAGVAVRTGSNPYSQGPPRAYPIMISPTGVPSTFELNAATPAPVSVAGEKLATPIGGGGLPGIPVRRPPAA